jgi:UMF1 family MFS transporter
MFWAAPQELRFNKFCDGFCIPSCVFFSPLLSGTDYVGDKKSFMKFFCYLGALSCMGLYWFNLENIYIGLMFYFWIDRVLGSLVFYNSTYLILLIQNSKIVLVPKDIPGYIGSVSFISD